MLFYLKILNMRYFIVSNNVKTFNYLKRIFPHKFNKNLTPNTFYSTQKDVESQDIESKIIYNSLNKYLSFVQLKNIERRIKRETIIPKPVSYALKFITDIPEKTIEETEIVVEKDVQLPYSSDILNSKFSIGETETEERINWDQEFDTLKAPVSASGKKWMNDYEKYTSEETEEPDLDWDINYGSCNPSISVSNVPCGGCGAFLHCQDFSIPGYIPSEIFNNCEDSDLRALTCQRCHFFHNYNTALSVSVDPDLYPKLLSKIKNEKALVILMVDLTDFPCSIWPGILDIIGRKRPIFLVGNKIDLLWGDSNGWMDHVAKLLKSSLPSYANVKQVQLISAKTGFGVEDLITKLHNVWEYRGDVYLVGCTNVGKSTLFNALLQSDYCKVKARDLVRRATTSPWPGTTLNLLKFPILRPEGWRLYLRVKRLQHEKYIYQQENLLKKEQLQIAKIKLKTPAQLIGHIGTTFYPHRSDNARESFSIVSKQDLKGASVPESGLEPNDVSLESSRWFYDTPGVLHRAQNLDLLTTEEIVKTLPKQVIEPKTFIFKPEWTLFIGGLGRLDFIEADKPIRITVFASEFLPITICLTKNADEIYDTYVGTEKMGVPIGQGERLKKWPYLKKGNEIPFSGLNHSKSCGDIVFSSAGWISITPFEKQICTFLPWTPDARGIYVRVPSILPYAVSLRGRRIPKTPAYSRTHVFKKI